jgi:AraC-like DNA-binding protein
MVMATGALIATSPARTPHTAPDARPDTVTAEHTGPDTDTTADMTTDTRPWPDPDPWPEPDTEPAVTSQTDPAAGAVSGTAAAVARLHAADPGLSAAAIAARLGVSDRTVRRHLARLTARPPLHLLPTGPGPDPGGGAP